MDRSDQASEGSVIVLLIAPNHVDGGLINRLLSSTEP